MVGRTNSEKLEEVRRWHVVDNGWRAIGYAYVIMFDGERMKGRDLDRDGNVWEETGAGAKGHNSDTIHIALEGGHGSTENDSFFDHYTMQQNTALRKLIDELQQILGPLKLEGHNEVAAKACPGFNVRNWYAVKAPRGRMGSGTAQGATAGAIFLCGSQAVDMTSQIETAKTELQSLMQYAPQLEIAFVALSLVGIAYALYRRVGPDWARGRR